jgi:hypothetical protein
MAAAPSAGDLVGVGPGLGDNISAEGRYLKRATGEGEACSGAENGSNFHAQRLVKLEDEPIDLG